MGRIRVLSDQVANKIAAGEVVERPASVVKELLENSLDAGATHLRIEVDGGGSRLIRVADNGCGMLRDDALLAFERHATSKLSSVAGLDSIATLGFRGEALPSIAAVSRLVLETRSGDEDTGMRVEAAAGRLLRAEEAAMAVGTTVTVRDLFYSVPARRKFLRSEQTELAHIASLATQYSLAHPGKTFLLRSGANELLHVTAVGDWRERVYQIFGGRVLEELVDLGLRRKEIAAAGGGAEEGARLLQLSGLVSRPQVQRLNRNSIFLFVNGRLIRDRLLMHALSSAYHNLMPAACYPFALLFLECDCREVDVNVHPAKTEVRFRCGSLVHDFVRDSIRAVLMESRPAAVASSPPVAAVSLDAPQAAATLPFSEFTQRLEAAPGLEAPSGLASGEPAGPLPEVTLPAAAAAPTPAAVRMRVPDTHRGFPEGDFAAGLPSLTALADLRPLGQLHDSFIVAAGRDGLWIVDQHVAHERILFEQILRSRASGRMEMQRLLMPIVVELTPAQQVEFARIASELQASGFDAEPFGQRTVAVKAAPAGVAAADVEKILFEILETAEQEPRGLSLNDLRRVVAASIACRAAIKVNTPLERSKMEWLLAALAATDCPMSCPHGRPVALCYANRDILRGFHRI